ncbi:hypothetical protein [Cypionkella psychrotolerans]|uniref:hypothetical protein n=1 Tax=Cypionkella psychrotolerans TaxID=1678131 RepID=UPI000AA9FD11|nr:hypothetical protein [Cypionkella psychrotolerans]
MKAWRMMIVGVLFSAISGGAAALAVALVHDSGLAHALLSYPLGGMLAIMAFAALGLGRQDAGRS